MANPHRPTRVVTRLAATFAQALVALALAVPVAAHAKGGKDDDNPRATDPSVAGQILVRLRSTAALPGLLTKYGLALTSQFGARPIYRLTVIGNVDVDPIIEAMALDPAVLVVDRNAIHRSPEARRNDPWAIGTATNYQAQWAPTALRLREAHAISTGKGVRVAVLDTGIDATHPAFAGRLLPGYDFVDGDRDPSEVGSTTTSTSFGHGTHVAGLVALAAPGASIMPLRVLDADGAGNAWVLGEAMLYAVDPDGNPATDDGAHVINLSLGSVQRTEILDTLSRLASCAIPAVVVEPTDDYTDPGYGSDRQRCGALAGAVVVAAAGNDGSESVRQYPAAEGAYGLMSVGASNAARQLASFSNFGSWVDVAAPGDGITSAIPGGLYGTWSGTSMAAPLAAGVAALVRAREPALSAKDLARRVTRSAPAMCGSDLGRVDAVAALGAVRGTSCD